MDPVLILLLVFLVVMIVMSRRSRTQQTRQRQELESGLQPGTGVMTVGGFYGRVVDVDGDVVTLESPSGVETIWSKTAVRQITEPPFAPAEEPSEDGADATPAPGGTADAAGGPGTGTTGPTDPTDRDERGTDRPQGA